MKRIINILQQTAGSMLMLAALGGIVSSCDSILDFDKGDCSIEYRVKFKYDYNMEFANAFSSQVKSVTLYAFDENGTLAYQKTEQGERLAANDYAMTVEMTPGNYEFITWAGLDDQSFAVPLLNPGTSKREALNVLTRRNIDTPIDGQPSDNVVRRDLPSLFHGRSLKVHLSDEPYPDGVNITRSLKHYVDTVDLMKNTNNIRIAIVQRTKDGKPATRAISKDKFSFAIRDNNGFMNFDNSLLADEELNYQPFHTEDTHITTRAFSEEGETLPAAVAELSTVRLLETQTPRLDIIDKEKDKPLLPGNNLISYLKLLKEQNLINMPLQEYLDREDHFSILFFVDDNLTLISSVIEINNWIVHIHDIEL